MKKHLFLIALLSLSSLHIAIADDPKDQGEVCVEYCKELHSTFYEMLPPSEKDYWQGQYDKTFKSVSDKFEEIQNTRKPFDDYGIGWVYFLNTFQPYRMTKYTDLVNEMGKATYHSLRDSLQIDTLAVKLSKVFRKYRQTENAPLFYREFEIYHSIMAEYSDLTCTQPAAVFSYTEKGTTINPTVTQYVVIDWLGKCNRLKAIQAEMIGIDNRTNSLEYLAVKDPYPFFAFFVVLLGIIAQMPSYLETYKIKYNRRLFFWLCLGSIVVSVILVVVSGRTWLNAILGGVMAAGLFVLYRLLSHKKGESDEGKA